MEKSSYQFIIEQGKSHWWFWHQRRISKLLIDRYFQGGDHPTALDVGCGAGLNMQLLLQPVADAYGFDFSDEMVAECKKNGIADDHVRQFDANNLDEAFPGKKFDLVTMFNVLNQVSIRDDVDVLGRIRSILKDNGIFLLQEPAFLHLRRKRDKLDHARTRYNRSTLRERADQAGLSVLRAGYFNSPLYPPALMFSLLDPVLPASDHETSQPGPVVSAIADSILRFEAAFMRVATPPFGLSVFIVATPES